MPITDTLPQPPATQSRLVDTAGEHREPGCTCGAGTVLEVIELRELLRELLPFAARGAWAGLGEFGVRDGEESRIMRAARLLDRIESGEFGPFEREEPASIANPKMAR